MTFDTFAAASRLRYRLPLMQRRLRDARRITTAFLRRSANPYVSYSTGKDSLVALDLALAVRSDVQIVWHDENWVYPGTLENIEDVERHYAIHVTRVRERFADDEFYERFGVWPVCRAPRPVDFEADTWREIQDYYGWDGAIIALRKDESPTRDLALRNPLRWHRGRGEWRVSPVHDWSFEDVWAYILGKRLPYHAAYEKLIDFGVEPKFARIGPFTAVRVYSYGILTPIKRLWPDEWNRFVAENPCVQSDG